MSGGLAHIEVEAGPFRTVVTVYGEIDLSNARDIGRDVEGVIDAASVVMIDMRPVEFMDSQGVHMLHELARHLAASEIQLEIVAPSDSVAGQVLRLTQMDAEVPLRESLD